MIELLPSVITFIYTWLSFQLQQYFYKCLCIVSVLITALTTNNSNEDHGSFKAVSKLFYHPPNLNFVQTLNILEAAKHSQGYNIFILLNLHKCLLIVWNKLLFQNYCTKLGATHNHTETAPAVRSVCFLLCQLGGANQCDQPHPCHLGPCGIPATQSLFCDFALRK